MGDFTSLPVTAAQGVGATTPWAVTIQGVPYIAVQGVVPVSIDGIASVVAYQGVGGSIPWTVAGTVNSNIVGTVPVTPASSTTWYTSPAPVTFTKISKTITTGGVSEIGVGTNTSRRFWRIVNPGIATEPLYVDDAGTATHYSIELQPGEMYESGSVVALNPIQVMAATAGHPYTIWQRQ